MRTQVLSPLPKRRMTMPMKTSIGVDLGGTKIAAALVDEAGVIQKRLKRPTNNDGGPPAVERQFAAMVRELLGDSRPVPVGAGVGVAGQIDPQNGDVRFAPNLDWHDVPLRSDLQTELDLPVAVTNDVRAITWGEWRFGAGKGHDDIICMYIGTGVGGGIVSGGRIVNGCSNTAGEIGHIAIQMHGPMCHCGNRGCLEAFAGGRSIARRAREIVSAHPEVGKVLLDLAGGHVDAITTREVAAAYHSKDALARNLVREAEEALVAAAVSLVNAFNPCLFILGGGVIDGLLEIVAHVDEGVRLRGLAAATSSLRFVTAELGGVAGVVGAAALSRESFSGSQE